MAFTVTEKAAEEVARIMTDQGLDKENTLLRLGVKGGGCSGFSYSLDLTDDATDQDERFESNGVGIVCDRKSLPHLDGTELDFSDGLMGRGFVFNNPNSVRSCGCGQSFEV